MTASTTPPTALATPSRRVPAKKLPYALVLPGVVVLLLVAAWPTVKIIQLSLQQQEAGKFALFHNGSTPYVGLRNYVNVLTDRTFQTVVLRTLVFTVVNVTLTLLIGMGIALLLTRISKWVRPILVAVLLFVWAVPS